MAEFKHGEFWLLSFVLPYLYVLCQVLDPHTSWVGTRKELARYWGVDTWKDQESYEAMWEAGEQGGGAYWPRSSGSFRIQVSLAGNPALSGKVWRLKGKRDLSYRKLNQACGLQAGFGTLYDKRTHCGNANPFEPPTGLGQAFVTGERRKLVARLWELLPARKVPGKLSGDTFVLWGRVLGICFSPISSLFFLLCCVLFRFL